MGAPTLGEVYRLRQDASVALLQGNLDGAMWREMVADAIEKAYWSCPRCHGTGMVDCPSDDPWAEIQVSCPNGCERR